MLKLIKNLLVKKESLLCVDIGSTSIRVLELNTEGRVPVLMNIGATPIEEELFENNVIVRSEFVAEQMSALLNEMEIVSHKRIVTALPGPSVFTKKITMPKMDLNELSSQIQYEAASFIPHNIDQVRLDYHIIGSTQNDKLEILVVAVKNEILDSFLECFTLAGLETAVVDVDYFALQNMYELVAQENTSETVALVNMGSRYSSINICRDGNSLFTGDIALGGNLFTSAIAEGLQVTSAEAEIIKRKIDVNNPRYEAVQNILDHNVEYLASELNRQLSFFWSASGEEDSIDRIMITGGGSQIPGLLDELRDKTGLSCDVIHPFQRITCGEEFDQEYLKTVEPLMGICVGMGIRTPGDRVIPKM